MKTMFKMTLGKKIFILLMISFLLMNMSNIVMDYHKEKAIAFNQLINEYEYHVVDELQKDYYKNNQKLDESFYKKVDFAFKSSEKDSSNYSVFVLNTDLKMVYNQLDQKDSFLRVKDISQMHSTMLTIHLEHIDNLQQLESVLKKQMSDDLVIILQPLPSTPKINILMFLKT